MSHFYTNFDSASSSATAFDNKVSSDSMAAGGQDYLSLTSLAARQAFGAIEYTNTPTEPWLFMKEISSDGNVNTVDGKSIFKLSPTILFVTALAALRGAFIMGIFATINGACKLTESSHIPFPSDRYLHER